MEFKFMNKKIRLGNEERFSACDLAGENIYYGGVLFGTKGGGYALIQWIENPQTEQEVNLNTLVEIV